MSLQNLESKDLLKYVTKNLCQVSQAINELFPCQNYYKSGFIFFFSQKKRKLPSAILSIFALGKPVDYIIEKNILSGSHFSTKPREKILDMNVTLFIAVSTNSFRIFDRILMPTHAHGKTNESR